MCHPSDEKCLYKILIICKLTLCSSAMAPVSVPHSFTARLRNTAATVPSAPQHSAPQYLYEGQQQSTKGRRRGRAREGVSPLLTAAGAQLM